MQLGSAATIKYPPSYRTLDCGQGFYYPGQETWWISPNAIGGCIVADSEPAPVEILVVQHTPASYTDTSACGGHISSTPTTVDGVHGTRYEEGPCTSQIDEVQKGPSLYFVFDARRAQVFLDYHPVADLASTFDTMVNELRFAG